MATSGAAESDPRTPPPATADRLDSWKEIASYLKRSARTVTRREREQGLPVHRHTTGTVYAMPTSLSWTPGGPATDSKSKASRPLQLSPGTRGGAASASRQR